jgi:hypothetical protein
VAVGPDGSVVVALTRQGAPSRSVALVRVLEDGHPDPRFGSNGQTTLSLAPDELFDPRIAVQRSGRIVVLAEHWTRATVDYRSFALVGVGPDGTLDPAFGDRDSLAWKGVLDARLALAPDDGIVLAATQPRRDFNPDIVVRRLGADGRGPGSEARLPAFLGSATQRLAIDARGAAIVSGNVRVAPGSPFALPLVARFGVGASTARSRPALRRGPAARGHRSGTRRAPARSRSCATDASSSPPIKRMEPRDARASS